MQRMALNEAIAHLNRALELASLLSASLDRDGQELAIRTLLGTAWMAARGWSAPEVGDTFRPALVLARRLNHRQSHLPVLFGLWVNVMTQGRFEESVQVANEMLAAAEAFDDTDMRVKGYDILQTSYFYLAKHHDVLRLGERVKALYDREQHRRLADLTNHDSLTAAGIWTAASLWMLGYPEKSVQTTHATWQHARQRAHPWDLAFALTAGTQPFDHRCEPEQIVSRVAEGEAVARAHSIHFIPDVFGQIFCGIARVRAGALSEGVERLRDGIGKWNGGGANAWAPYFKAVLAEGIALQGDEATGLALLEESLAQIERPGWDERVHLAEILRLKGWMLQRQGRLDEAEASLRAGLDVARQQDAKSWELRTAASYARLMQSQGRCEEALELLKPVYDWFTEGFDTKDLKEAKALLEELA